MLNIQYFFSAILFYLVIYPLSKLPYRIIYWFSDFIAFVLEYIVSYRKKVIYDNLKNSFPNKNHDELIEIRSGFYKHFSDLLIEILKSFSLSKEEALKRISFSNLEDFNRFYKEGKDVLILLGHYGNWELAGSLLPQIIQHNSLGIYKPLSNRFFDIKMQEARSKFGVELVPMKETGKKMRKTSDKPRTAIFLTDQRPANPNRCYWTNFLNQETGVLFGAEKFSKVYDMPVIYMSIYKKGRGCYDVHFDTLCEFPKETKLGEITNLHTQKLEEDIIKFPSLWLWSHKRWKHKRPS